MAEMKPPLSAEEWERQEFQEVEAVYIFAAKREKDGSITVECGDERWGQTTRPHALAALALHGQPFGFTWEDVRFLREVAFSLKEIEAADLADRIAALLPPRENGPENP